MSDILTSLRERYSYVHLLLFARSVERSSSPGELFDILEELPLTMPVAWDEAARRWTTTDDILQSRSHEMRND